MPQLPSIVIGVITIQSSCGSSSPQWSLWISGSRCSRIQRTMHRWCPWSCGLGRGTAPGGADEGANCKLSIFRWGKNCSVPRTEGEPLPSTSWKCSQNSSDPHSQNHLSWTSLHTGRRPGTCPSRKDIDEMKVKQTAVVHQCSPRCDWSGLPSACDLRPHLHPISAWGTAASCWWSLQRRTWLVSGIPAKTGETWHWLWSSQSEPPCHCKLQGNMYPFNILWQ